LDIQQNHHVVMNQEQEEIPTSFVRFPAQVLVRTRVALWVRTIAMVRAVV